MSWSDPCSNCGQHRADCDCGDWNGYKKNNIITNTKTHFMSKALTLLKSSKTLEQRANEVIDRIKKDTELTYIDVLQRKVDNIKDQIADLSNFSLETNINKGQMALSIEDSKKRFVTILELEYQLKLAEKELEVKKEIFNEYFNASSVETK